jgi:thiosulfate dehydrogenase [quinone] large subunit
MIGYFFFRIFVGMNLFLHGVMRFITGMAAWEIPQAETFTDTYLPMPLVHLALYMIPPWQVLIGACMILGLWTRWAFIGGLSLMFVLLYGHLTRQNWAGAHIVMHYGMYYWIMLVLIKQNWLALDNRRATTT